MGSEGEGSQNERSSVTVQVQLRNGSKISIQTELDKAVQELKQALVDQTGIPSDEQMLFHMGSILRNPETLRSYDMELGEYIRPILEKLYPIPYIVDYVWDEFNVCGSGTRNMAVPEKLFASQLAEMEKMGFMDRRENIIALLISWGDAKKAVKRLNFRKTKSEEAGEGDSVS